VRAIVANQLDCPNIFVVDDVGNVLQSNGDHDPNVLTDIKSLIPANLAVLVWSLTCWMAIVLCLNDMAIETWSIADSKCVMFLIVTLYVDSSDCLTNSFMALTFSLDFLVALFAIALIITIMSLSLSLLLSN
jgi:hypothetical protein